MLVKYLIALQLNSQQQCLLLDKYVSGLYKYKNSESTKRNVYRYSEVVHVMGLQDYLFICGYTVNINVHKLGD